jgi:4-hydroxy-3-polyprenylbenzoate decarboxylase
VRAESDIMFIPGCKGAVLDPTSDPETFAPRQARALVDVCRSNLALICTMSSTDPSPLRRIIVGISGASGIVYGVRTLEVLRRLGVETHLVMTRSAQVTLAHETTMKVAEINALADCVYRADDLAASIASGSFPTAGMVVAPCSIRSLSEIAAGVTSTLLTRAGDVVLKERRRLVLMVRETPLHLGHLRSMAAVTEMGAVVMPPVPAFYAKPETIDDVVDHTVGRALELFGLETGLVKRWGGRPPQRQRCTPTSPTEARIEPGSGLCLDGPQWAFAVDFYGRRGVASACLALQDILQADVSLLLFALFAAARLNRGFDDAELKRLDAAIAPWREQVVRPLRGIRTRLRAGPGPAPDAATEPLRELVKSAELRAEQVGLAVLARWLDANPRLDPPQRLDMPCLFDRLVASFAARSGAAPSRPEALEAARTSILEAIANFATT